VFVVVGSAGTGQHGDRTDSTVETGGLLHADCGTRHLQVAITEGNIIEAFDDSLDNLVVSILTESNALKPLAKN
jgi:hypothetical protein